MDKLDFIMEIEGINRNSKRGLVASGKVNNGVVCLGDCLEIVGKNNILKTYVAAIEKLSQNHKKASFSTSAVSGDNIQVLLTNSRNDDIDMAFPRSLAATVKEPSSFLVMLYCAVRTTLARSTCPSIALPSASVSANVQVLS